MLSHLSPITWGQPPLETVNYPAFSRNWRKKQRRASSCRGSGVSGLAEQPEDNWGPQPGSLVGGGFVGMVLCHSPAPYRGATQQVRPTKTSALRLACGCVFTKLVHYQASPAQKGTHQGQCGGLAMPQTTPSCLPGQTSLVVGRCLMALWFPNVESLGRWGGTWAGTLGSEGDILCLPDSSQGSRTRGNGKGQGNTCGMTREGAPRPQELALDKNLASPKPRL